jgi:hypothetical protein
MERLSSASFVFLVIVFVWSCKKNNVNPVNPIPSYTVPSTYNFINVNDSNQLKLIAMADQLVAKINLANTIPATVVSAQTLINMFNNTGNLFNDSARQLNASGISLAQYFPANAKADMLNYFDSVGVYSQSTTTPTNGNAGVAPSSATPTKKYLLSANGVFYSQVIKKTMMGIFAYQIANVYLTDSINNSIDNTTVITGSGTALEHHWDEAFGFFGVPVNFPSVTAGLKYLGSYSNQVDAGLHSNTTIMNAFLTGRAAITNKDLNTKQTQANILIAALDSLNAAAIVQEMHETDENIEAGDAVAAYGTLSEAIGFVRNLKYNTGKRVITDAQISQLMILFDAANPNNPNLYNFVGANINTVEQIEAKTNAIAQFIGSVYGFDATTLDNL